MINQRLCCCGVTCGRGGVWGGSVGALAGEVGGIFDWVGGIIPIWAWNEGGGGIPGRLGAGFSWAKGAPAGCCHAPGGGDLLGIFGRVDCGGSGWLSSPGDRALLEWDGKWAGSSAPFWLVAADKSPDGPCSGVRWLDWEGS